MKVSLWQLNAGYQALLRLAQNQLPKEHHKLTYKLSKIVKAAKVEIEALGDSQLDLMAKCGLHQGEQNADIEKVEDFNRQSKRFMRETVCDIWGDPFTYAELRELVSISALDLADLDWLIIEGEETIEKPEAKGASA